MSNRLDLHQIFKDIMPIDSKNVYYQPPESIKMNYPAIIYERSYINNSAANNKIYIQNKGYSVTVIDKNPDSDIVKQISKMPKCHFNRHFVIDNLNQDTFTIFY